MLRMGSLDLLVTLSRNAMATAQRIVMGGATPAVSESKLKVLTSPGEVGWTLLGRVGVVFVGIGLLDVALGWTPTHFGSPEWEFGTIAHTLDSLPVTVLGLAFVLAAAIERRAAWAVRATALLAWVLAAFLVVGFAVFLLDVPVALKAVTDATVKSGLHRAIAKALVQGVLYPSVLAAIGWQGVRATRRERALV